MPCFPGEGDLPRETCQGWRCCANEPVAQLAEGEATSGGGAFREWAGEVEKHIQAPHRKIG